MPVASLIFFSPKVPAGEMSELGVQEAVHKLVGSFKLQVERLQIDLEQTKQALQAARVHAREAESEVHALQEKLSAQVT